MEAKSGGQGMGGRGGGGRRGGREGASGGHVVQLFCLGGSWRGVGGSHLLPLNHGQTLPQQNMKRDIRDAPSEAHKR